MSSTWTAARLPRLDGTRVVITGATRGIGLATARGAAAAGAEVVVAARSTELAVAVAARIGRGACAAPLDLTDRTSILGFVDTVGDVDVLVNNAGILPSRRRVTGDGFEAAMATNMLGPFLLTNLLLPRITRRVVNVESIAHRFGTVDIDDPHYRRRRYSGRSAYAQSKLAGMLWTLELDRRLRAAGSAVGAVAAHPGWAATTLTAITPFPAMNRCVEWLGNTIANTPERGAACTLYAAGMPVASGSYVGPMGALGLRGAPGLAGRSARAGDVVLAGRVWELAEHETGSEFPL